MQDSAASISPVLLIYSLLTEHKDSLPALNQAQTTKLKHLSLVSLSMDRRVCRRSSIIKYASLRLYTFAQILPYAHLLQALQMPTIRELEDLIIDAIYLDLLRGKLDQKQQQFEVEYTLGRDLEPGKIESLLAALQDWCVLVDPWRENGIDN